MAEAIVSPQEYMVARVASALGSELLGKVAFVGGCATALLVTDAEVQQEVRFTEDVDVIVHVMGHGDWRQLERQLAARGFFSSHEDDVLCRKRLREDKQDDVVVDFMPDDESILGFSNRWYSRALASAIDYELPEGPVVRVVSGPYFLATKIEAYKGRGKGDPLGSRDIEDIVNLVSGRETLISEVEAAPADVQEFIADELSKLLQHRDFAYVVASAAKNKRTREAATLDRFDALVELPDGSQRFGK